MISLATLTALATYRAARTPLSDRKSVLVIDYNPPIRELLALTLEQAGYRVTTVDGGQAALTWIEDALRSGVSPALVLLDLSIPWDRRLGILHQVRAQWDTGPCPVPRILILGLLGPSEQFTTLRSQLAWQASEEEGFGSFSHRLNSPFAFVNCLSFPFLLLSRSLQGLNGVFSADGPDRPCRAIRARCCRCFFWQDR